jgi:predicted PurR-regulated permease PerM
MEVERGFQIALFVIAGSLTLLLFLPYLTVILGAILLAYVLSPAHERLAPHVGERIAALGLICSTLLLFLLPFILLTNTVLKGIGDLLGRLGENDGLAGFEGVESLLGSVFGLDLDGGSSIVETVQRGEFLELVGTALDVFGGVSDAFVHVTILLFVWYYLLKDGDTLLGWITEVVPLSTDLQSDLFRRADEVMYAVVIGNFIVAVADGVLVGIGLWIVGFSDIVFWTFICVFLALIPLVGTMLVWVPAAAYLIFLDNILAGAFLIVYGFGVVGSVDNVLRPFVGSPEVGLGPAIFVVGVLTGLSLFGVLGIFYGPVLLVMTKVVFETLGEEFQQPAH